MATHGKRAKPGGGRGTRARSALGKWIWLAALLSTMLVAGEIYAGAVVLKEARARLSALAPGSGVASASINLLARSARLSGIRLAQPAAFCGLEPAIEIPRLEVVLDWRTFLDLAAVRLRRVVLDRPVLRIFYSVSGGSNLEALIPALTSAGSLGEAGVGRPLRVRELVVQGGEISVQELAPDATVRHTLRLKPVKGELLKVGRLPGEEPLLGRWAVAARVEGSGAIVSSSGSFRDLARPLSFDAARFDCEGLPLAAVAPQMEALAGCRPISGRLFLRARGSCARGTLRDASISVRVVGGALEGVTPAGRELSAYLRSRGGDLEEEFRLGGDLADPEVGVSGLVSRLFWRKLGRGVWGVATFPLRLVGALMGAN